MQSDEIWICVCFCVCVSEFVRAGLDCKAGKTGKLLIICGSRFRWESGSDPREMKSEQHLVD